MFDNLKKISELKAEVKTLNEQLTQAREDRDDAEIKLSRERTDHEVGLEDERNIRVIAVNKLENNLDELEKSIPLKVAKEVAFEKKDLKSRGEKQDREHDDRMKKLDTENNARIAKADRDLETDKVSYRKYLRSEVNTKMEALEKDNKRLVVENITLTAKTENQAKTVGSLEGQVKTMEKIVDGLTTSVTSLSKSIGEGLVKALPTITADFETPVLPENHVHVEVPAARGGNQGGANKEQKN